ncbi:MAG TPA: phytoene/squalene synthase family protein [Gemmatimonadales bacterium]
MRSIMQDEARRSDPAHPDDATSMVDPAVGAGVRDGGTGARSAPDAAALERAERFCREILPAASRTFAIGIRVLPGTLGRAVLASYLICRVADTVEDERSIAPAEKDALLGRMLECLDDHGAAARFAALVPPLTGDAEHARLVRHADDVFTVFHSLPEGTRRHVRRWVTEMVTGMRDFVLRHPQGIRIRTLAEYREYCHYVAGTVGYLLTDLWHEHSAAVGAHHHQALLRHCEAFGQALQAVNILKDVARDAVDENSIYVPEEMLLRQGSSHATLLDPAFGRRSHAAVTELIELAWRDLDEARRYLLLIPRRAAAIRLFCALPLLLAHATLRELTATTAMLTPGSAPRITRREVKRLVAGATVLVTSNAGLGWLVERARRGSFA